MKVLYSEPSTTRPTRQGKTRRSAITTSCPHRSMGIIADQVVRAVNVSVISTVAHTLQGRRNTPVHAVNPHAVHIETLASSGIPRRLQTTPAVRQHHRGLTPKPATGTRLP